MSDFILLLGISSKARGLEAHRVRGLGCSLQAVGAPGPSLLSAGHGRGPREVGPPRGLLCHAELVPPRRLQPPTPSPSQDRGRPSERCYGRPSCPALGLRWLHISRPSAAARPVPFLQCWAGYRTSSAVFSQCGAGPPEADGLLVLGCVLCWALVLSGNLRNCCGLPLVAVVVLPVGVVSVMYGAMPSARAVGSSVLCADDAV